LKGVVGWHGEMGSLDVLRGQGKAKTFENMLNFEKISFNF